MQDEYLKVRIVFGVIAGVVLLVCLIAVWIDRRTEAPIMRERVNEGSDDFLRERGSVWHEARKEAKRMLEPPG